MTNEEKVEYWINLSDYDLETAEAMHITKRYLYVGFMCHQVIEKIFKALYSKLKEETPPYTHKLTYLAQHGDFYDLLSEEQRNFTMEMEPLNIKTRYIDYKNEVAKKLSHEKCTEIIEKTKNLQLWIKEKLLSTN